MHKGKALWQHETVEQTGCRAASHVPCHKEGRNMELRCQQQKRRSECRHSALGMQSRAKGRHADRGTRAGDAAIHPPHCCKHPSTRLAQCSCADGACCDRARGCLHHSTRTSSNALPAATWRENGLTHAHRHTLANETPFCTLPKHFPHSLRSSSWRSGGGARLYEGPEGAGGAAPRAGYPPPP